MAYKISWTPVALDDYEKIIDYLIREWSISIAIEFDRTVNQKLLNLSHQPFTGIKSNKDPLIRSILFTTHNRLYYRIKDKTIELLNIMDTRQDPAKNRF